ncbi:MAG: hypothetical protein IJU39_04035 [Clostridia bacterium]|nr:hypothetical protein [Clostridia bacterium]
MKKNNNNNTNQRMQGMPPIPFIDPDEESRKNLPSEAPKWEDELPDFITEKNVDDSLKIEIDNNQQDFVAPREVNRTSNDLRNKLKYILVVLVIIITVIAGAMIIYDTLVNNQRPDAENVSVLGKNLVVTYSGDKLSVRSDWSNSESLLYIANTSSKLGFEIEKVCLCDRSVPRSDIPEQNELLADLSKSISTVTFAAPQSETVGINNGLDYAVNVSSKSHSLKAEDIGSVLKDSKNRKYTIIKILNNDNFIVYPSSSDYSNAKYKFELPAPGNLTFLSGNKKNKSIRFEKSERALLYPYFNNVSCEMTADSQKLDVSQPGDILCSNFKVEVSFDVPNVVSCLKFVENNVGKNNNDSFCSGSVKNICMTLKYVYSFTQNGACSVSLSVEAKGDVTLKNITGITLPVAKDKESGSVYIPGTADFSALGSTIKETLNLTENTWENSSEPPYRFSVFIGDKNIKGISAGFCPAAYNSSLESRKALVSGAGKIDHDNSTVTLYALSKDTVLKSGDKLQFVSYIIPFEKNTDNFLSNDLSTCGWYQVGDDVYFTFDTHRQIDKKIMLPSFMEKMDADSVDVSNGIKVELNDVDKGYIQLKSSSNYGYAVIKLSQK